MKLMLLMRAVAYYEMSTRICELSADDLQDQII